MGKGRKETMARNRALGGGGMGFGSSRNPMPTFGAANYLAGKGSGKPSPDPDPINPPKGIRVWRAGKGEGWEFPGGDEDAKTARKAPSDQAEPLGGRKLRRPQVFYPAKTP
jgi:hypothetical protein